MSGTPSKRGRNIPRVLSLDRLTANHSTNRSLSDSLSESFGALSLQPSNSENSGDNMANLEMIQQQLSTLLLANQQLTTQLTALETKQAEFEANTNANVAAIVEYTDIVPVYANGDAIQLEAFKVIPAFNGERKVYRSWRSQVTKLMDQIKAFKVHPKYATALAIIRAKITGVASDILINNDTAHNIDAIIDRLDFSYSDQRPLYVIEAEMTNIKQGGKTLQEFYDQINQALNMVITKIAMSYKETAEQKSLTTEAQSKAVRTFMTGLNSQVIRSILYGSTPNSLSQAFAIAQTIHYDNQHLQLDTRMPERNVAARKFDDVKPNYNPNFRYQSQSNQMPNNQLPNNQMPRPTNNLPQQKPTPMDVDRSAQHVRNQAQPNAFPNMKRQHDPSMQNANRPFPSSFQHVNKQQRINHIAETDDVQSLYADSLDNNCESDIPETSYEAGYTTNEQEGVF